MKCTARTPRILQISRIPSILSLSHSPSSDEGGTTSLPVTIVIQVPVPNALMLIRHAVLVLAEKANPPSRGGRIPPERGFSRSPPRAPGGGGGEPKATGTSLICSCCQSRGEKADTCSFVGAEMSDTVEAWRLRPFRGLLDSMLMA